MPIYPSIAMTLGILLASFAHDCLLEADWSNAAVYLFFALANVAFSLHELKHKS